MTLPTVNDVRHPRAQGFGAQLDDLLLRLHAGPRTPVQVETAPAQANRVQTSVDREEMVSDYGEKFGRSDFTGGEGLDWAHRPNQTPRDARRFYDSQGIYVGRPEAGTRRELTLLRDVERLLELAADPQRTATIGTTLYVTDGTDVRRGATVNTAPAWTVENPNMAEAVQQVAGLAAFGDQLFAALGVNGVHLRDSAGVWTAYSNLQATGLWVAKARLFVAVGRSLYEVSDAAPNPTVPLRTLPPGHTWVQVIDAGDAILAAGSDGYVYAWTVDDAGALALAQQTLIQHEIPTVLGESQGKVFIGTRQGNVGRLWSGTLNQGQFVGEVIREWDTGWPTSIVADREQVYTIVAGDGETHAWRYDVVEGGLFRHYTYPVVGSGSLALIEGALFAAIAGSGVWQPAAEYVADGWLIGPLADFFSADVKLWIGAQIDAGVLPAETSIELWFTTDPEAINDHEHPSWTRVRTTSLESPSDDEVPMLNVAARALAGMIRMYPNTDRDAAPTMHAYAFRAYPSKPDVIVTVSVNVSDMIGAPGRASLRVPGRGAEVYAALQAREGTNTLLRVYDPAETVRGIVESVGTPIVGMPRRGSATRYSLVRVRGKRVSLSGVAVDGAFGVEPFGVAVFGGSG